MIPSMLLASFVSSLIAADLSQPNVAAPCLDKRWFGKHNYLVSLVRQASQKPELDLYFLGDSITEFWPELGKDSWQREFGKLRVLNCGVSGDTTQNILYRIEHGEFDHITPKVVVLLAGINNLGSSPGLQPGDLASGLQRIVATLRRKSPASKILLLSIFPSSEPTDPIRGRTQATNLEIAKLADNANVFYLDIYGAFLDANGVFPPSVSPDGLHLYAKGYQIWADAMRPTLQRLLDLAPSQ